MPNDMRRSAFDKPTRPPLICPPALPCEAMQTRGQDFHSHVAASSRRFPAPFAGQAHEVQPRAARPRGRGPPPTGLGPHSRREQDTTHTFNAALFVRTGIFYVLLGSLFRGFGGSGTAVGGGRHGELSLRGKTPLSPPFRNHRMHFQNGEMRVNPQMCAFLFISLGTRIVAERRVFSLPRNSLGPGRLFRNFQRGHATFHHHHRDQSPPARQACGVIYSSGII